MLRYALFLLCALLPFQIALNPAAGFDVALVRVLTPLMALGWLVEGLRTRRIFIFNSIASWSLLSFLFLTVFSLFFAQNITWGLRKILFLLSIAPLYFIVADLTQKTKTREKIISLLVLSASALALVGLGQFLLQFVLGLDKTLALWSNQIIELFLGKSFTETVLKYPSWLVNINGHTYFRAIAFFPDPHMLAFYLNMILPFAGYKFFLAQKKRLFWFSCMFIILLTSLLTFSRGGYLGLTVMLLAGIFLLYKRQQKKSDLKLLLIVLAIFILFFLNTPLKDRFVSSFSSTDGSNQGRVLIWKKALTILAQKPQGVGIGNYPLEIAPTASYRDPIYAHNIYLDIALEIGLWGLFFWLSFFGATFWRFKQNLRQQPLFFAGFLSLTAFAFHGLVENPLFSIHVFILLMLITALQSQKNHEFSA